MILPVFSISRRQFSTCVEIVMEMRPQAGLDMAAPQNKHRPCEQREAIQAQATKHSFRSALQQRGRFSLDCFALLAQMGARG